MIMDPLMIGPTKLSMDYIVPEKSSVSTNRFSLFDEGFLFAGRANGVGERAFSGRPILALKEVQSP